MDLILDLIQHLSDPNWLMQRGGLYLVVTILFIESGLFFGFFLPGDPLLFISGMIIAAADQMATPFTHEIYNLIFWESLFILSAVLGNFFGFWFGSKFGHHLLHQEKDYWLLKRKHVEAAHQFYQKKGGFAITIARFLPVARTFVPIIGGVVGIDFKKFTFFNILGAVLWVGILVTAGFLLGENPWVNNNLEWMLLGIVILVTLPVIVKMILPQKKTISTINK